VAWKRGRKRTTRFAPEPILLQGMILRITWVKEGEEVPVGTFRVVQGYPKATGLTVQDPNGMLGAVCVKGSLERRLGLVLEEMD
jgi:hypothetical protein